MAQVAYRPKHAQPINAAEAHQQPTPQGHHQQHGREHTSTTTQHTRAGKRIVDLLAERRLC
eukprot:12120425-Prorocentrum_lima.AAC.1